MLDWLATKSQGSSCLYCSTAGIASAYHQAQHMQIDAGVNLRFSRLLGKQPSHLSPIQCLPYFSRIETIHKEKPVGPEGSA